MDDLPPGRLVGPVDALKRSVRSGRPEDIRSAVDGFVAAVAADSSASEVGGASVEAAELLRGARRFDALLHLADETIRMMEGSSDTQPAGNQFTDDLWHHAIQALIELGAQHTADQLVEQLLARPARDGSRLQSSLLAQRGRMRKSAYVRTRTDAALQGALAAYVAAYAAGADRMWAGVNTVALRAAAQRRGLADADGSGAGPTVDELLALAATAPVPRSAWAIATELELRLARGEAAAMTPLLTQLFDAPDADGFVFTSLARQLDEIWDLDPSEAVMVMLGERTLASGRGEVVLPRDPGGYEKTFGDEFPIPINVYRQGLERAKSVGSLLIGGAFCVGTTFVMRGADLHPTLAGRNVLATNEHVVPDPKREQGTQAAELVARFDGVADASGNPLSFGGLRAIWHSVREELDVTLLVTDAEPLASLSALDIAPTLPVVRGGAYVYVVGHPGGGGLQLSIRGNDLIDHDGIRLHYEAPTEKGSSGSPVFDQVWNLIGVHHRGANDLRALNGAIGTYPANEGLSIDALKAALASSPPTI